MNYTVYLSSTLKDLEGEREAVRQSLSDECLVKHSYLASENALIDSCLQDVAHCDVYILIMGMRYGYVPERELENPNKLSITELEYQHASDKPRLVFIKDEGTIPFALTDAKTKEHPLDRIEAFRKRAAGDQRAAVFETADDLKLAVVKAFNAFKYNRERRIAEEDSLGSTSSPLAAPSPDWPKFVVESLSTQLNDDFAFHMGPGEDLSANQTRARCVQEVLKARDRPDSTSARPKGPRFPREGPLEDFLATDGAQLLVIGVGGSGKTTMLKHLAAEGASRAVQEARAPIYLYLRLTSFDRGDGGFDLLLDRLSIAASLDREEFEALWRKGRRPVVFLLDGLNEVAKAYQPSCSQALQTFLQHSPPLHRCVITSRPGGEFEAMCSHSVCNPRLGVADILNFGPQQVQEYLKAQGRIELQSRISGRLEDLASNPFLLWAITCILVRSQGGGPKNRGSLYAALIDRYIFGEREQNKPRRAMDYNYELVKKPVLAQLALKMTEDGVTVVADSPELWTLVSQYLLVLEQKYHRKLPLEAEVFMPTDNSAVSFLRETVSNGVLVRDGDGLRFMHECVQEYFAAVALGASTIEGLVRRVPPLKLARIDARGPMFETLVTWAGLSTLEKVISFYARLKDKHPLLAAHLAVEGGLPDEELQKLRHQFLSNTASEHEQRQRLGAMGLAVAPSQEPAVVARLIEMLDVGDLSDIAKKALKAVETRKVVSALVKASVTRAKGVDSEEAELLRELAVEHSGLVAEVLLDAWTAGDSQRDRVAELAAYLDASESWEKDRRALIRETLLTLSVEAELGGNYQKSSDLDALRQHADEAVVPSPDRLERAMRKIAKAADAIKAYESERDKPAAAFAEKEDAALEVVVRDGEPTQSAVALDMLVGRRSPAAVAYVINAALRHPDAKWLNALESLPREPVQQQLAERIEILEGKPLERARFLAGLFADRPLRDLLESVFQDCGANFRALAARAALRASTEGVELLIGLLSDEVCGDVLDASVRALGGSRNPVALARLLDLLFDRDARQHWPSWSVGNMSSDGWASLIHEMLADAGAADTTLERLEHHLRLGRPVDARDAVDEARRWLPATRAVELLRRAMTHEDLEVRRWAQWSLACAGNADAWRALLQTELDTPPDGVGLAQDAAQCLESTATDPAARDPLIAASKSVLRPALFDPDGQRRATALELTCRLPEQWVEAAWRREVLVTAELLMQSGETDQRGGAVWALHHFADDGDERVLKILTNSAEESVTRVALKMLGDKAAPRLEQELQFALRVGDAGTAQHIADLVSSTFSIDSGNVNAIRDSGKWLDEGNPEQCVAALLALTMLCPENEETEEEEREEWKELSNRACAAFQRHSLKETWRLFAVHARSLSERHREFIYLVLDAFAEKLEEWYFLLTQAEELWPDDLRIMASCVLVEIQRGNRDQATERLTAVEERFHDRVNHVWVGDQFEKLNRPHDALRYYRIAVELDPTDDVAYFKAGWFAFVNGDLEESIESTRCSLKLQPTRATAEFNLGVALLARRDTAAAEAAYRRGVALARRQAPADTRQDLEGALGDLSLLPECPPIDNDAVDRIRKWLQKERDHLGDG